jgi:hypothetical protein
MSETKNHVKERGFFLFIPITGMNPNAIPSRRAEYYTFRLRAGLLN